MQTPTDVTRTASVHWEGDVARGKGTVTAESGFVTADYSFGTRFSGAAASSSSGLVPGSQDLKAARIDADEFQRLAKGAKENCPISRALHAVEIELDARLNP